MEGHDCDIGVIRERVSQLEARIEKMEHTLESLRSSVDRFLGSKDASVWIVGIALAVINIGLHFFTRK